MQGFIIKVTRVRNEDLLVRILTPARVITLYRFYGARHSVINLGFKVDFETELSLKTPIARMREVIHLGYGWMHSHHHLLIWHQFIALFDPHLYETEQIDPFYFTLLEDAAQRWGDQNPKRTALESYVALLAFEGRLHRESWCVLCDGTIEGERALIRGFLPTHEGCSHRQGVPQQALEWLYDQGSALFLEDDAMDRLWHTLCEGL